MTYAEDQDNPEENFLIDFLYVDRARIQTLSSQLFPNGHLTQTKQSTSTAETSKLGFQGGIPGVLKGNGDHNEAFTESIERQFDATWSTTLDVLRELNDKKYIVKDLENALLGQVVQFKGHIQVNDLRMMQKLWQPMLQINSKQQIQAAKGADKVLAKKELDANTQLAKVIELLPHMLQMRVWNSENAAWSTIEPSYLTINPLDLVFKHGAFVPGEWTIISILDAKPSDVETDYMTAMLNTGTGVTAGMPQILRGLREAFGRGPDDYGITPIAIYRKVNQD